MKTVIISIVLYILSNALSMEAQNDSISHINDSIRTPSEKVIKIKEKIIQEEKEALKNELNSISSLLEKGKITKERADSLRMEAAKKHALNIENRVAILENKVALEERDDNGLTYIELGLDDGGKVNLNLGSRENDRKYDRRTTSDLVIAAGLNNAISSENTLDNSEFKIGGSRFFEIGWAWKTRVFDNSNWLRLKYGISFQFNGLKPVDNQYFVENGDLTQLQEYPIDLDKSKFRTDNLVVPIHFEFGPSKKTDNENYVRFSTDNQFKIGLGGYGGFNIGERQKLKYKVDGDKKKEKIKNDFNTNDLVYGLSSYLSFGGTALYVKYDLNPLFQDPNPELHNISFGLRFDID